MPAPPDRPARRARRATASAPRAGGTDRPASTAASRHPPFRSAPLPPPRPATPPAAHRAASCAGRSCRAQSALSGSISTGHGPLSRLSSASPAGPRAPCSTPPSGRSGRWHSSQPGISRNRREHRRARLGPCRIDERVDIIRQPDPDRQQFANPRLRQLVKRQHAGQPLPCPSRSARAACRCRNASTTPAATPATGTASRPATRRHSAVHSGTRSRISASEPMHAIRMAVTPPPSFDSPLRDPSLYR